MECIYIDEDWCCCPFLLKAFSFREEVKWREITREMKKDARNSNGIDGFNELTLTA